MTHGKPHNIPPSALAIKEVMDRLQAWAEEEQERRPENRAPVYILGVSSRLGELLLACEANIRAHTHAAPAGSDMCFGDKILETLRKEALHLAKVKNIYQKEYGTQDVQAQDLVSISKALTRVCGMQVSLLAEQIKARRQTANTSAWSNRISDDRGDIGHGERRF